MKAAELKKLRKEIEKILEPKRFEHTLGVAYTAAMLAKVHGADADKAMTAGLLHDCAKCISFQEQLALCERNHVPLSRMERETDSPLIHAKAGGALAGEKFGIDDEDIINAIYYHTTGRPKMSRLEKVIYIADYIEPGRKAGHNSSPEYAESLSKARKLAYQDLDAALFQILSDTLKFLTRQSTHADPMTQETYEYYARMEERNGRK